MQYDECWLAADDEQDLVMLHPLYPRLLLALTACKKVRGQVKGSDWTRLDALQA